MEKCKDLFHFDCCFDECHDEEEKVIINEKLDMEKVVKEIDQFMKFHPVFNKSRDKWIASNQKSIEICEKLSKICFDQTKISNL